jgi:hypothetical protein
MVNGETTTMGKEMNGQIKHTPGPWKVVESVALDYRAPAVYGADGRSLVAIAEGGGRERAVDAPEARANAHLIAAAPDLFAAIIYSDDAHWTPAMRAALKKAIGGIT